MPLPFDATLKDMVRDYAADFLATLGQPADPAAAVLNVDLSTVSAATDVALGHGDPPARVTDFNFQSGPDPDLAGRLLLYNALLHHRLSVPVHTVVVLLRPAADHAGLTGRLRYDGRPRRGRIDFRYEVVRLWQRPARGFLHGGLGTLPLAPLCRLPGDRPPAEGLPPVLRRIDARLRDEAPPDVARRLMTATYVLTGLRLPREQAADLFRELLNMRESSTYQGILEEGLQEGLQKGRLVGLREGLLLQGRIRFGTPDQATVQAIERIADPERLKRMSERLLSAASWQDLLATP